MPRRDREQGEEGGTPIAALIDVVFLLIIFFLVTANVQKEIVDKSINLPQVEHVKPQADRDPRRVIVNVHDKGKVNISQYTISLGQLQNILTATANRHGNSVPVVLRVDAKTQYHHVDKVMRAVGRAGLYKVKISAKSPGK